MTVLSRFLGFAVGLLLLSGCGNLFLYPDRVNYFPEAAKFVNFTAGEIPTSDGLRLHYWLIPAQKNKEPIAAKGLVILAHGNAQNLTAHVRSLGWITEQGYSLAIFDYRGYGSSSGSAELSGAFRDVSTALDFITAHLNPERLPVFFYGQSLGGTLLLKTLAVNPRRWNPRLVVIESSFVSFPQIGSEKLASFWLTWPLQWMAYLLVPHHLDLKREELQSLAPTPVLLFYSEHDRIVPVHNGREIFQALAEPKEIFYFPEPGHIAAMWVQDGKFRQILLGRMAKVTQ